MVEQLLKAIKTEQREILSSFVENPCTDMADYQRRVGQYFGLGVAEQQALILVRPKESDDAR